MARIDTLNNFLLDIANKFRDKLGITGKIEHIDYDTKIDEVYEAGYAKGVSSEKRQAKEVTPTTAGFTVLPDDGYTCLTEVVVKPIPYVENANSAGGKTVTIG